MSVCKYYGALHKLPEGTADDVDLFKILADNVRRLVEGRKDLDTMPLNMVASIKHHCYQI